MQLLARFTCVRVYVWRGRGRERGRERGRNRERGIEREKGFRVKGYILLHTYSQNTHQT
jgi:hypothetical protein